MHSSFSSTEEGISINLSKMNSISVNLEAMTITVQVSALYNTWLAIDNLLSAEVVLANRQVVIASESENRGLFWAPRGAGASFGVATRFAFRAHERKSLVWGGTLVFNKFQLTEVIKFANHTMEEVDSQATMMVGFSKPDATLQPSVVAVMFYNWNEEAAKSFYAPLLSLNPVSNQTAMVPFVEGSQWAMKGSALLTSVSAPFIKDLFEDYSTLIEEIPDATKSVVLYDFFNFKKILSVLQTATPLVNRGAFVNVLFATAWNQKYLDSVCQEWTLSMADKTRIEMDCQRSLGTDATTMMAAGEYKNYDSNFGSADAKKLFGVNYERLVALKKFYDPENGFAKGHNLLPGVNDFDMQVKTPLTPVLTHGSFIGRTVAIVA
ncbi:hypothetical protein BDZ45DRAFT_701249 [Acephala macrosclerotiorum]|nr:hypothetical protein BDZ45DRAFT_701249 [Acephala macrosclerotiorum]